MAVFARKVTPADAREFLALMSESKSLHDPWIKPPLDERTFDLYMDRVSQPDHEGFLICHSRTRNLVGVINVNNIVRGSFLSASLGYYVGLPYLGKGYMQEGIQLVKLHAFKTLGLHRLEANIQPENRRSIALVQRSGFHKEGLSPAYLYIAGAWRDHERWAIIDPRLKYSI